MEHSRVALPEPEYLARIGEIAYTVSSMEWTLLDDLHRLAAYLPAPLTLKELEPQTTGAIGACASKAAAMGMAPGPVREFIAVCGTALTEAAKIRNDVLHARPATHPEQDQRLSRTCTRREGRKEVRPRRNPILDHRRVPGRSGPPAQRTTGRRESRAGGPPTPAVADSRPASSAQNRGRRPDTASPVTCPLPHTEACKRLCTRYTYPERDHTSCLPVSMTSKARPPIPAPGTTPSARQFLARGEMQLGVDDPLGLSSSQGRNLISGDGLIGGDSERHPACGGDENMKSL